MCLLRCPASVHQISKHRIGSNSKTHTRNTILIFVTPTIVQDSDYQPTPSHFLSTKPDRIVDTTESSWDSAVPFDWTKPRTNAPPAVYEP